MKPATPVTSQRRGAWRTSRWTSSYLEVTSALRRGRFPAPPPGASRVSPAHSRHTVRPARCMVPMSNWPFTSMKQPLSMTFAR